MENLYEKWFGDDTKTTQVTEGKLRVVLLDRYDVLDLHARYGVADAKDYLEMDNIARTLQRIDMGDCS